MSIDKQRTNKLLTEIDQLTVKAPIVFPDDQINQKQYLADTQLYRCYKCNELHTSNNTSNTSYEMCWNCYYSLKTVNKVKTKQCSSCSIEWPEGTIKWFDVPTIDGVIYPGQICKHCIYDCAQAIEAPVIKPLYNEQQIINDDALDAFRYLMSSMFPGDSSVPEIFREFSLENWSMPVNIDNNIYRLWVIP